MHFKIICMFLNLALLTFSLHFPHPFQTITREQSQKIMSTWTKKGKDYKLPLFWISNMHMASYILNDTNNSTMGLLWKRKYLYNGSMYDFNPYMVLIDVCTNTSNIEVMGIIENPDNQKHNNSCIWLSQDLQEFASQRNDTIVIDKLNSPLNKRWYMLLNYDAYFTKIDDYVFNITSIKNPYNLP